MLYLGLGYLMIGIRAQAAIKSTLHLGMKPT